MAAEAVTNTPAQDFNPFSVLWGFVFVVSVLTLFSGITAAMGAVFQKLEKKPLEPVPVPVVEDDSELVAVIAAAVHTALHAPVRIVSIKAARSSEGTWAAEGRRQIFSSHRVR